MGFSGGKKKVLFGLVRAIVAGAAAYVIYTMLENNSLMGGDPLLIYGLPFLGFLAIYVILAKLKGSD